MVKADKFDRVCSVIPQSHQTLSYYILQNGLKLCVNYMNVVQTTWTGYDVQNFEPAQNFLVAIPFWAGHSQNLVRMYSELVWCEWAFSVSDIGSEDNS